MDSRRPVTRLAPDVRAALLPYGARASWPAGFAVYQRQQPSEGVFVVLQGRIVLRTRVKAGRGFVPLVAAEGETFGAEGLIPGGRYASETLHLSAAQLRQCLREQPIVGGALLAQLMVERTALLDRLRELATLSVEERLVAAMVRMADQQPGGGAASTAADTPPLVVGPSQYRLLCELVGATRESVSLVLNRLVTAGAVEREGQSYAVRDLPALAARLSNGAGDEEAGVPTSRDGAGGGHGAGDRARGTL